MASLEAAFGSGAAAPRSDGLEGVGVAAGGDLGALAAGLHLPPAVADPAAYTSRECLARWQPRAMPFRAQCHPRLCLPFFALGAWPPRRLIDRPAPPLLQAALTSTRATPRASTRA